ncbi:unnamed protein product [Cunninghamella echinulata]
MTFNIRIADTVLFYQPDIIGFQELFYHQVIDLHSLLGEEYDWIGVGRVDGKQDGEHCAIFYKKNEFSVKEWKTIWLSETPEKVGSQGWNAKHPRVATIATFIQNNNNRQFYVFNTHYDHISTAARVNSSYLLLEEARKLKDAPVILLGDFNTVESDEAYHVLTNNFETLNNNTWQQIEALNNEVASQFAKTTGIPVRTTENSITLPTHRIFRRGQFNLGISSSNKDNDTDNTKEIYFKDTRYQLKTRLNYHGQLSGPYGHEFTFTSFGEESQKEFANRRIDYIFYLSSSNVHVSNYAILENQYDDGLIISDHRPIIAQLSW